jgi:PPP family 3-phenylpropionic acid transporter
VSAPGQVETTRVSPEVAVRGLFVLTGFVVSAFFPFFALVLDGKGLGGSEIGLVIAAMAVARMIANPVWGHIADTRTGRVAAVRAGAAGAALSGAAVAAVAGVWPVAIASAAIAVSMVGSGPNLDAIALAHLGDERMADYGQIRALESLTYAAGCLVFGTILELQGVAWAMPIFAIANLATLAWTFVFRRDRPVPHAEDHGRLGSVGSVFKEAPRFWGFLVAVLLVWTGFNAAWNFLSLKIAGEGGGPFLVGVGTALGGLVEVLVMRRSSSLQRRYGLRRMYVVGCLVYALGFLLWGLITDPTIVSVLTVFEGLAFSLLFTTGVVIVGKLLPQRLYSTGNAVTAMVGFGMGPILGAGIGGYVFEHFGPTVLYLGAAALATAGAVVAWFALDLPKLEHLDDVPEVSPGAEPEPGLVP